MSTYTCPSCTNALLAQDRFCPACGTRVAGLEVVHEEMLVGEGGPPPRVEVRNSGRVPVSFCLPAMSRVPPWLQMPPGANDVRVVPPGSTSVLTLEHGRGRTDDALAGVTTCELRLVTDADLAAQDRRVRLALVGRAALRPDVLELPCLPMDRAAPVPLPFELTNGGGRPLRVERVEILPAAPGDEDLAALVRIPAALGPHEIAPGASQALGLVLAPVNTLPPWESAVRRGGVQVRCHFSAASGVEPAEALLLLTLARPPRLAVVDAPGVEHVIDAQRFSATLRNDGAIPFEVTGLECPAPWVKLEPFEPRVLGGGDTCQVDWTVSAHDREGAELRETRLSTDIRVHTEPLLTPTPTVKVQIQTEAVEVLGERAVLGIDFGTTGSAVSLYQAGTLRTVPLALELRPARSIDMPSLMYFAPDPARPGRFVYGVAARNRANVDPQNLVRSLKRVLTREPDRQWHFSKTDDTSQQFETWRTSALAEEMLRELVVRAARAYRELPARDRTSATSSVRFTRAVFTHPVRASERMVTTLFDAARSAGLHGGATTLAEFRSRSLLDEASAAVLHYLVWRGENGGDLSPEERVLCVDIGGGTTDVTAVHARMPDDGPVLVDVLHCGGENRFGGEDIDRDIALGVLDRLVVADPELRVDLLREALDAPSARDLRVRLGGGPDADRGVDRVLRAAHQLLVQAEQAKIALDTAESHAILLQDLPRGAGAGPSGQGVEVTITRAEVEAMVERAAPVLLGLVDDALRGARWTWDQVDTLLFTGKSCRSANLRQVFTRVARARRTIPGPREVDPTAFDPKGCVAAGAAYYGAFASEVQVRRPTGLFADICRGVPLRKPVLIPGLHAGAELPARGRLTVFGTPLQVHLYAGSRLLAHIVESRVQPGETVEVVAEADGRFFLEWTGGRVAFTPAEDE